MNCAFASLQNNVLIGFHGSSSIALFSSIRLKMKHYMLESYLNVKYKPIDFIL